MTQPLAHFDSGALLVLALPKTSTSSCFVKEVVFTSIASWEGKALTYFFAKLDAKIAKQLIVHEQVLIGSLLKTTTN